MDGSFTYGESDGTETQNQGFLQNGVQEALNGTLPGHVGQFFNPFVDEALGLKTNAAFYNDKQVVTGIWQDNQNRSRGLELTRSVVPSLTWTTVT